MQRPGSLEKKRSGRCISSCERSATCRQQVRRRSLGKKRRAVAIEADSGSERICLLQVVAQDFLELETPGVLLHHIGESLVQLCAQLLRQSLVCTVADEHVMEAEPVPLGGRRCVRPHQPFADERQKMRCQCSPPSFGKQAGNGGHRKVPSNDGSASDHVPLVRAQAIEPLVQQGMDSRRDAEHALSAFVSGDRRHLLDEERIALGGDADLLPQLGRRGRSRPRGRRAAIPRPRREWLERKRVHIAPGARSRSGALHEFGAGEHEYEDGRVAAPSERRIR